MSLYDVATAIFIQNFQKRAPINTTKSSHFDTFFCFSLIFQNWSKNWLLVYCVLSLEYYLMEVIILVERKEYLERLIE